MDRATFWELIDTTREASGGDPFQQAKLLTEALTTIATESILDYYIIFRDLMDHAYIADLWDAAYIIGCGCSDDGFVDFRAWLIGRGKDIFDLALSNPESLADVIEIGQETQDGALPYVATHAYEIKTGAEMPRMPRDLPKLKGVTREEPQALARFPKLAAKFWKSCQEEIG